MHFPSAFILRLTFLSIVVAFLSSCVRQNSALIASCDPLPCPVHWIVLADALFEE